jgi:hypothetical protein
VTFQELPFALTWREDAAMGRTAHALVDAGRVWLVDPFDADGAVERARALGTPAGVIQLLDRHNRDGSAIAERLGVALHVVPDAVPDSPFELIKVLDVPGWHERALWWPGRSTLVVAEAVGTGEFFTAGLAPVAVHPMLRPLPPRALRGLAPDHLLVGHGPRVDGEDARKGLPEALARSRKDIPRWLVRLPGVIRAAR